MCSWQQIEESKALNNKLDEYDPDNLGELLDAFLIETELLRPFERFETWKSFPSQIVGSSLHVDLIAIKTRIDVEWEASRGKRSGKFVLVFPEEQAAYNH